MDLRSYCALLARRWRVLVATFAVVCAAVAGGGLLIPSTYTANVRIAFAPNISASTGIEIRQIGELYLANRMKTYAQVVTTNQVLQPVIDSLDLDVTVPGLAASTEVTIPAGTTVIELSVTAETGAKAASIANRIANEIPWGVASLEGAARVAESPVKVTVLQPADIPLYRSSPNVLLNLIVAVGLALLAAVLAAVLVDNFDTRVRKRRDVTASGVSYLGGIPRLPGTKTGDVLQFAQQKPPLQTLLRRIALDVVYAVGGTPTCLIFTSPRVGADKTMVAANIAGALAETGNRVGFIDADARGGGLAAQVGIPQARGITDLMSGGDQLDESAFDREWGRVTVIPSGGLSVDIGELLAGEKFGELLNELSAHFDVVIVDAPPITSLSEASRFTQNIRNVVVVAEATTTRRAELLLVANSLRQAGAKILGVVLSRVRKDELPAPADEEGRDDEATSER